MWPAHWAYRALTRPTPPTNVGGSLNSLACNPVDQFIQAGLVEHHLAPAPEADKATLLRRLTFDLTGLPPTPAEQDAFLADSTPDAYERVVDRLLASPHYGERRRAIGWTWFTSPKRTATIRIGLGSTPGPTGITSSGRSIRTRLMLDSFRSRLQATRCSRTIPGLSLPPASLPPVLGMKARSDDIREDSIDREIGRYLDRDDIVTTAMGTFASTTAQCARCHDHKFDPISQKEYYGLQAVFAGTDKANRAYDPDPQVAAHRRQLSEQQARLNNGNNGLEAMLRDKAVQKDLAEWERKENEVRSRWLVLEASALRSAAGTILMPLADGSILATGTRPDKDTYTVVAHLGQGPVTAIRLEVLTDGSLPSRGPGRQENGNLHLSEFSVVAATRGRRQTAARVAQSSGGFQSRGLDHCPRC